MVVLKRMTESEFKEFFLNNILRLAKDNLEIGLWDATNALTNATQQTEFLLKSSVQNGDNTFYSIFQNDESNSIGSVWIVVKKDSSDKKSAFIYDIIIQKEFRNKGYGTATLQVLQNNLKDQEVTSISLHVLAKNKPARQLYLNFGFIDTSYYMKKFI